MNQKRLTITLDADTAVMLEKVRDKFIKDLKHVPRISIDMIINMIITEFMDKHIGLNGEPREPNRFYEGFSEHFADLYIIDAYMPRLIKIHGNRTRAMQAAIELMQTAKAMQSNPNVYINNVLNVVDSN